MCDLKETKEIKEEKKSDSKVKICLLVDKDVDTKFLKKMMSFGFSAIIFTSSIHSNKLFKDIETSPLFIINISNDSFLAHERSSGMHFYELNQKAIKEAGYCVTYCKTTRNIRKDNIDRLAADYVIGELPSPDIEKKDAFIQHLMYNKMPQVRSSATVFWQGLKNIL